MALFSNTPNVSDEISATNSQDNLPNGDVSVADASDGGTDNIVTELKIRYSYPIELEKKLRHAIINGDYKKSKEMLNLLLGQIFFSYDVNFEIIKHRIIELIALLSRAAIDRGMDITQVLMLNTDYFLKIETIKTLDELNSWLVRIINRFIGYMFEFNDVKYHDVLNKVTKYIQKHYNEKITLDMVCKEVFLSKAYLSKIFNNKMNCSFTQYVNKIRIQKSKPLLFDNKVTIIDIAYLVGFEDQSYFTKVFKQIEGISPGEYRRTGGLV
jgi:YesN/AraC family two-component response regulator